MVDGCDVGLASHVLQMEGSSPRKGLSLAQRGTAGTGERDMAPVLICSSSLQE